MKFLPHEYDSVKKIIEDRGLDYSEFSFVKRRGGLYINWSQKEKSWRFHRKKESSINSDGDFEQGVAYFIGHRDEIRVETWDEVLEHFEAYLES